jgi:hypothetical protein
VIRAARAGGGFEEVAGDACASLDEGARADVAHAGPVSTGAAAAAHVRGDGHR